MKGYPDDPATLPRAADWNDLPMFSAPLPSGPSTTPPPRQANTFAAYCAWKRSEEGGKAFGWMLTRARERLAERETRIGMKALVERCREDLKTDINNTWTAWLADDLVAADDRLAPLIERRTRRKSRG